MAVDDCDTLACVGCRYLNKPPSVVQFKTVIFGSNSDNDEHKAKLVNPTYENPGYVDVDDDEVQSAVYSVMHVRLSSLHCYRSMVRRQNVTYGRQSFSTLSPVRAAGRNASLIDLLISALHTVSQKSFPPFNCL